MNIRQAAAAARALGHSPTWSRRWPKWSRLRYRTGSTEWCRARATASPTMYSSPC